MFLTRFYKKQNIVVTMPVTMLIAHPYRNELSRHPREGDPRVRHQRCRSHEQQGLEGGGLVAQDGDKQDLVAWVCQAGK